MHTACQHLALKILVDPDMHRPIGRQGPALILVPDQAAFHLGILQNAVQQAGVPKAGLADLRPEIRIQKIRLHQIIQQV